MLLDIDYILLGLPGLTLALWAQGRIWLARWSTSRKEVSSGLTGAEAADEVLQAGGVSAVEIEPAAGLLADYYDLGDRVLRLSARSYAGRSLAAVGIAAHEAGHAIQQETRYPGVWIRDAVVPIAGVASTAFWILISTGLLLGMFRFILAALYLLEFALLPQLLNLPVEFDASRRARQILLSTGMISSEEDPRAGRIVDAAAWTHVAGTLTSFLSWLGYLVRLGLRGRRRMN